MIELKKEFVLRKRRICLLLREEKEEVHKLIDEQLRKGYIRLSKLSQTVLVVFVEKRNGKEENGLEL